MNYWDDAACCLNGIRYTLLSFVALSCFYSCCYRSKMRQQYLLQESPCCDCCVHFFCQSCALCQEYRELKNRGFDMTISMLFLFLPKCCYLVIGVLNILITTLQINQYSTVFSFAYS